MRGARPATSADADRVLDVLRIDPVESVAIASWVQREGVERALGTGRIWVCGKAVCYSGANLLPVNADPQEARGFAELAAIEGRRCSSIVGRLPTTGDLWHALEPYWGPARAVRERQLVMVADGLPTVPHDPLVRFARLADADAYFTASVAMYQEEIGTSPIAGDGGFAYRRRIAQLIGDRCAFVRMDGGQVVFKAELGAVTSQVAQLQGVWVHPELRGQGLGTSGTAALMRLARASGIPRISLAVNDFNTAAVRSYLRCGFDVVGEQLVVLF